MGLMLSHRIRHRLHPIAVIGLCLLLSACLAKRGSTGSTILGRTLSWNQLPGWQQEQLPAVWPGLLRNCQRKAQDTPAWKPLCTAAALVPADNDSQKAFLEQHFVPRSLNTRWWQPSSLITGYYVPVIDGSLHANNTYHYPLYRPPADLVRLDLGPGLQVPTMGRLHNGRVTPYPTRAKINAEDVTGNPGILAGQEIVWLEDPIDRFFLHIQGSGRIELADGTSLAASYAANNGQSYHSIGKELITRGEMTAVGTNLYSLKQWLHDHPLQRQEILNSNPRYIFFNTRKINKNWSPNGAFGLPLTAGRSLAVDPDQIPLGSLLWLDTTLPGKASEPYRHLMLAQDRGAAIKGRLRADLFWGQGKDAERLAGHMKQAGRLYLLAPKSPIDSP